MYVYTSVSCTRRIQIKLIAKYAFTHVKQTRLHQRMQKMSYNSKFTETLITKIFAGGTSDAGGKCKYVKKKMLA